MTSTGYGRFFILLVFALTANQACDQEPDVPDEFADEDQIHYRLESSA